MRPIKIPSDILHHWQLDNASAEAIAAIHARLQAFKKGAPEVSVVIPAYNEKDSIVKTLSSLSANNTNRSVEIIVVNNNSADNTRELAIACGATCIDETKQGITNARNAGLNYATGKYVLNADADSIYPSTWIEEMVSPLANGNAAALTYGQFAFIPVGKTTRNTYFFYEYFADFTRWINKTFREEAVNVYGFNSGFRREQGLSVEGFDHPPGTNEDGFLALKLRNKGFGKLHCVPASKSLVWTTDRRILLDGGIQQATFKRVKRMLGMKMEETRNV
ncbi:MAG: glycosyltransferase family 2 protein [Filimonas sp.]|nr:glycosyltransferase family 2 protein [Filimonas sp.]